jgi:alkylation response protein AidB-like acyl-CoA dehydrogenase
MRLAFTEEQEDLRSSVRQVLADRCPTSYVRECWADSSRWQGLWANLQSLGWPSLQLPESAGGSTAGVVELVAVMELAGFADVPVPLAASAGMALPVLLAGGAPADVTEAAASAPSALVADGGGPPTGATASSLRLVGSHLSGKVERVRDAERAKTLVVTTWSDGIPIGVVVDAGSANVGARNEKLDPSSPTSDVTFDLDVPGDSTLTGDVTRGLAVARIALAAELVGASDRMLEMSIDHARARSQFGRAIGSFQAVQQKLVEAFVGIERARALTYAAAATADSATATTPEIAIAACLAKAAASEAGVNVSRAAVQVHGAIAMTVEHELHLFVRRAWMVSMQLGGHKGNYEWAAKLSAEQRAS